MISQDTNDHRAPEDESLEKSRQEDLSLQEIEEEIEEIDPNVLEDLSLPGKNKILRVVRAVSIRQSSHQGILPRPEDMERYNAIIPNGAERLMKMAENQSDHRMVMEKDYMNANNSDSKRGQIFGFFLALVCICAAVYLGMNNQPWLGGILGGSTILGLVIVFVLGQQPNSSTDKEQSSDKPSPPEKPE